MLYTKDGCCSCILITVLLVGYANCFNLDIKYPSIYSDENSRDSNFGQSVGIYASSSESWIVVGAPRSGDKGNVFKCPYPQGSRSCTKLKFPREKTVTNVTEQFGATVKMGAKKQVLICAPGYTELYQNKKIDMYGICYFLNSFLRSKPDVKTFKPCFISGSRGHESLGGTGLCQAGFDAVFTKNKKEILMSAPGTYWHQGMLMKFDDLNKNHTALPIYHTREKRPTPPPDFNGTVDLYLRQTYDSNMLGYTLATGSYGQDKTTFFAASAPRRDGVDLLGSVVLFDGNLSELFEIRGKQFGEYFGRGLVITDVNGDGLDDLVVGSPYFCDTERKLYDSGKISVFYQKKVIGDIFTAKLEFTETPVEILGNITMGKFGLHITDIGDINGDGYNDILVSAPFSAANEEDVMGGAVYVFNGGADGLHTSPSQVINTDELYQRHNITIKGFGYSASGNKDVDRNGYPDVVVGAYLSAHAVVFRARPIVELSVDNQILEDSVDIEQLNCKLKDGSMSACFTVESCFAYKGKNLPETIDIKYSYDVDHDRADLQDKRAFVLSAGDDLRRTLLKGARDCYAQKVYVKSDIRDKLSPFTVQISYSLVEDNNIVADADAAADDDADDKITQVEPVLNALAPTSGQVQVKIFKDCGVDDICDPDLKITSTVTPSVVNVNTLTPLLLEYVVHNAAEPAYLTTLVVEYPDGVSFVDLTEKSKSYSCVDSPPLLLCEIANPLKRNAVANVGVNFEMRDPIGNISTRTFKTYVNSTNAPESADEVMEMQVEMQVQTSIHIFNASEPTNIYLDPTKVKAEEIAENISSYQKSIKHRYEIVNEGPADIKAARLYLYWPLRYADGSFDLSLMDLKHSNQIQCPSNLYVDKEEAESDMVMVPKQEDEKIAYYNCHTLSDRCRMVVCQISEFLQKELIYIELNVSLHLDKLLQSEKNAIVSSSLRFEITEFPYAIATVNGEQYKSEVSTMVEHKIQNPIQIWIIIIAVLAGLVFLILIIIVLRKCGFFKRRRIPSTLEHQAQRQKLVTAQEEDNEMQAEVEKRLKN